MLFALLYNHQDQVIAAAAACEQMPLGDQYWIQCHPAAIQSGEMFETAYVTITDPRLQSQLNLLGIDSSIDASVLTTDIELAAVPRYHQTPRAA